MRKIKEVLRLHSLGRSQRQIARSCSVGQSTVSERLAPSGVNRAAGASHRNRTYASLRQELQTHKHVTLQLLWEEYREKHPDGYRYSRFCDLYRAWLGRQEVVLRHEHRAGEKLFVEYAGATIPIQGPATGDGGVPEIVAPDNLKSGVTKACR